MYFTFSVRNYFRGQALLVQQQRVDRYAMRVLSALVGQWSANRPPLIGKCNRSDARLKPAPQQRIVRVTYTIARDFRAQPGSAASK